MTTTVPQVVIIASGRCDVTTNNFDDLLVIDELFVDYFNSFLSLPTFKEKITFNKDTQNFEIWTNAENEIITKIHQSAKIYHKPTGIFRNVVNHSFRNLPLYPMEENQQFAEEIDTRYIVQVLNREPGLEWIKTKRLPNFLQSDLYQEYRLAKVLKQVRTSGDIAKPMIIDRSIDILKEDSPVVTKLRAEEREEKFNNMKEYLSARLIDPTFMDPGDVEKLFLDLSAKETNVTAAAGGDTVDHVKTSATATESRLADQSYQRSAKQLPPPYHKQPRATVTTDPPKVYTYHPTNGDGRDMANNGISEKDRVQNLCSNSFLMNGYTSSSGGGYDRERTLDKINKEECLHHDLEKGYTCAEMLHPFLEFGAKYCIATDALDKGRLSNDIVYYPRKKSPFGGTANDVTDAEAAAELALTIVGVILRDIVADAFDISMKEAMDVVANNCSLTADEIKRADALTMDLLKESESEGVNLLKRQGFDGDIGEADAGARRGGGGDDGGDLANDDMSALAPKEQHDGGMTAEEHVNSMAITSDDVHLSEAAGGGAKENRGLLAPSRSPTPSTFPADCTNCSTNPLLDQSTGQEAKMCFNCQKIYYKLSRKRGMDLFKSFLTDTAGEITFNLWIDIQKSELLNTADTLQLRTYLASMRSHYLKKGSPLEISPEMLNRIGLHNPNNWSLKGLKEAQYKLLQSLIFYWVPRYLLSTKLIKKSAAPFKAGVLLPSFCMRKAPTATTTTAVGGGRASGDGSSGNSKPTAATLGANTEADSRAAWAEPLKPSHYSSLVRRPQSAGQKKDELEHEQLQLCHEASHHVELPPLAPPRPLRRTYLLQSLMTPLEVKQLTEVKDHAAATNGLKRRPQSAKTPIAPSASAAAAAAAATTSQSPPPIDLRSLKSRSAGSLRPTSANLPLRPFHVSAATTGTGSPPSVAAVVSPVVSRGGPSIEHAAGRAARGSRAGRAAQLDAGAEPLDLSDGEWMESLLDVLNCEKQTGFFFRNFLKSTGNQV